MENVKKQARIENSETFQDFQDGVVIFPEIAAELHEMLTDLNRGNV